MATLRCPECGGQVPAPGSEHRPEESVLCPSCETHFHVPTLRCPECGGQVPAPGSDHRPEESVLCPSCETHFHVPDDGSELVSTGQIQLNGSGAATSARPKKKPKPSALGACLLACVALGIAGIVIVIAAGVGIHFVLGEEFVDDLLILARGVQEPPKSDPDIPRVLPEERENKPEPKELPDRLLGVWDGNLPNGNHVTLVYREKGECSIVRHLGKQPPLLTFGTWKVTAIDGDALRLHRALKNAPAGDLFAADATITFPAPNEMEHSYGKGTIRCRRQ